MPASRLFFRLLKSKTLKYSQAMGFGMMVMLLPGLVSSCRFNHSETGPGQANNPVITLNNPQTSESLTNFIADVVAKTTPAVVSITPLSRSPMDNPPESSGQGSGFIISSDGNILTNAHVIGNQQQVRVSLENGQTFTAKVLGRDPLTDIAVVKIPATDLPTIPLGNSDQLTVGEWAIAIGNPLGLSYSVTAGIISAMGRSGAEIGAGNQQRVSYIQTDAAINPGNSGGPLINQAGEVIGVNTAMIQDAQGLGFAIPINTAQRIATQIMTTGQAQHLFLGIRMVDLNPTMSQAIQEEYPDLTLPETGLVVIEVMPDSPAAQAGVQPGDLIRQVNTQANPSARQVQEQVEATQPGQAVQLTLERQGQRRTLAVKPQPIKITPNP